MFSVLQKIYYSDELSRADQTIYKSDDLNLMGEFSGSLEGLMVQVQFRDVTVCHTDQGLNPGVLWIWSLIVFDKEVLVTVPVTGILNTQVYQCPLQCFAIHSWLHGLILTILMEISADTGSLLSGFDFPECLYLFCSSLFFHFSFKLDYHVDL